MIFKFRQSCILKILLLTSFLHSRVYSEDLKRYVAYIRVMSDGVERYVCSGGIIRTNVVISAADCFHWKYKKLISRATNKDIFVYAGVSDMNAFDVSGAQKSAVEYLIIHEDWKPETLSEHNLALLVLETAFTESDNVQLIPTVADKPVTEDAECHYMMASARVFYGGPLSYLPIIKSMKTTQCLGFLELPEKTTILCGLVDKTYCRGNAGSPILCYDGDKLTMYGVQVNLENCKNLEEAVTYMSIVEHKDWMESAIKDPAKFAHLKSDGRKMLSYKLANVLFFYIIALINY